MSCAINTLVFVFLVQLVTADDTCGTNEVLQKNPDCKSDYCPGAGEDECDDIRDPCAPCKCGLMYLRADNGTCIPGRSCPPIPCAENEVFDSCPVCSEDCSNAVASGKRCRTVGRILITVICKPACRCIDFYWRKNKKCVPYEECVTPVCQ